MKYPYNNSCPSSFRKKSSACSAVHFFLFPVEILSYSPRYPVGSAIFPSRAAAATEAGEPT